MAFVTLRDMMFLLHKVRIKHISIFFILCASFLIALAASAQEEDNKTVILEEVNRLRKEGCTCGDEIMPPVDPLTWNDQLEKAAIKHANDMFNSDILNHTGSDGSSLSERVENEGYRWTLIGENISWGYESVSDAVNGWKGSPGHCKNMMNGSFREMGAAGKGTYWVLDLGKGDD